MVEFTLDDLRRVLRESAGEVESAGLGADILDTPFADLGYDSLAILATAAKIQQEYAVQLADEVIGGLTSPRILIDTVNQEALASSRQAGPPATQRNAGGAGQ